MCSWWRAAGGDRSRDVASSDLAVSRHSTGLIAVVVADTIAVADSAARVDVVAAALDPVQCGAAFAEPG